MGLGLVYPKTGISFGNLKSIILCTISILSLYYIIYEKVNTVELTTLMLLVFEQYCTLTPTPHTTTRWNMIPSSLIPFPLFSLPKYCTLRGRNHRLSAAQCNVSWYTYVAWSGDRGTTDACRARVQGRRIRSVRVKQCRRIDNGRTMGHLALDLHPIKVALAFSVCFV